MNKTDKIMVIIAAGVVMSTLIFLGYNLKATSFPAGMRSDTINATLLSCSAGVTNKVGLDFNVEGVYMHTIQANNTGTNPQQYIIDRSLDSVNWIVLGTNAVAAGGADETNFTGKFSYVRARQRGTNSSMSVLYLGGN